jgi:Reverse transcriptase (RNA-dependent DNA polymerase)
MFYSHSNEGTMIICCSTDNLMIAASLPDQMQKIKGDLNSYWEMTDLDELHWLLGIKVKRDQSNRTGSISQIAYINHICKKFNLQDVKPLSTPLDPRNHLSKSQSPSTPKQIDDMHGILYCEAVGLLMYVAVGIWPNIAFTITTLSQYLMGAGHAYWEKAKHVFHYLKGTRTLRITYGGGATEIVRFSDADWGVKVNNQHSVSGYLFQINGGPVSWSLKKQHVVALSSTEAEYIVLTHVSKEVVWLRSLLGEIYDDELLDRVVTVFSDNKSVISMVKNNVFHSHIKHIAIRYHYI